MPKKKPNSERFSTRAGELAAVVFARFNAGDTLVDVVQALKLPPRRVRALYAEWSTSLDEGLEIARAAKLEQVRRRAVREQHLELQRRRLDERSLRLKN